MADTTVEVEVPALVVAQVEVPAPVVVQIEVRTGAPGPPGAVIDLTEDVDGAITAAIDALVDASPGALDTLNELAAALGDDPNFATTVNAALAANATAIADETTRAVAAETAGRRDPPETPARLAARAASARAWALADTLTLSGYSPFLAYCNSIGTSLKVLHRYDEASGAVSADRRTGQTAVTGTIVAGPYARGLDTALDRGSAKATQLGVGSYIVADTYGGDTGGNLTFAWVIRFTRFQGTYFLLWGAGSGVVVTLTDEGSSAKVVVKRAAVTVATSTVAIADTWKDHLVVVSMGGSTASTRILIDNVECTGPITSATVGSATNRNMFSSVGGSIRPLVVSAFAEWGRQLSPVEETGLWTACQFSYRPRPMLHGIHSGLQAKAVVDQQPIVNATVTNLRPHLSRFELRWANIQTADGGAYDWSQMDSAVDKTIAAGMEPLVTVLGSPTWATGGADQYAIPAAAGFAAWLTAYVTFVTAAATRYKGRVRYWELWNEPNWGRWDRGFWRPMAAHTTKTAWDGSTLTVADASGFAASGSASVNLAANGFTDFAYTGKSGNTLTGVTTTATPDIGSYADTTSTVAQYTSAQWGSDFAALSNALRAAILGVDPDALVCTGGITGWGYGSSGLSGITFLTQAFAAGLALFAHYGLHPYPSNDAGPRVLTDSSNAFADLRRLRDFLIVNGRADSTVWATEFGWFFLSDSNDLPATATKMSDAFYDLVNYYSSFVDLFAYFVDYDRPASGFYGLLEAAPYAPKAYVADVFRQWALNGAAVPAPAAVIPVPPTAVPDPYDIDGGTA